MDVNLATLPQKKRTQIRRERKQPAMDGVTITTLSPEDLRAPSGAAIADPMHALYLTTVDKYYYGRRYLKKRFFQLLRERFAPRPPTVPDVQVELPSTAVYDELLEAA